MGRSPSFMRWRGKETLVALALAAVSFAALGHVAENQFVNFDDDLYVTDNPHVRSGLTADNAWWALTTTSLANWHPLTLWSFQLDAQVFGLRAGGFHLTNLLLHVGNSLLLFFVLHKWTGAVWRSALVAALFAWHPMHAESFAWVAERKDVLSTLFWMVTLAAYTAYVERPTRGRYGLVPLAFALGLMAKPMLVSLPFALLLLDYWPLGRWTGVSEKCSHGPPPHPLPLSPPGERGASRLLAEKIPLFALAAASCAITLVAQRRAAGINRVEPLPIRVENALVSCVTYLAKTVWPHDFSPYYPFPRDHFPVWQWAGAAAVLAGITWLAFRLRRTHPYLLMGWLWYLGTLLPVIGLMPIVGGHGMADRYTYVPHIGLFIAAVWGLADLTERWHARAVTVPLALLGLLYLLLLSWLQVQYWRDSRTLWQHALEVSDNNALAHNNLGVALERQGKVAEAAGHYAAAVRIDPEYATAHNNLGAALERLGTRTEAIAHYRQAFRLDPGVANRVNLARLCVEDGRWDEAVEHFRVALQLDPRNADVEFYLAEVNQAARLLATDPDPKRRNGPQALELARVASRATDDRRPEFLDTLAAAYAELGRWADAVAAERKAVDLAAAQPDLAAEARIRLRQYEERRGGGR